MGYTELWFRFADDPVGSDDVVFDAAISASMGVHDVCTPGLATEDDHDNAVRARINELRKICVRELVALEIQVTRHDCLLDYDCHCAQMYDVDTLQVNENGHFTNEVAPKYLNLQSVA